LNKDVGSEKDGHGTASEPKIGYVTAFPRALPEILLSDSDRSELDSFIRVLYVETAEKALHTRDCTLNRCQPNNYVGGPQRSIT
jgi:hypothetical protein